MPQINATQAARRLGVKKATLYAYVSRKLLTRTRDADGHSLFDTEELDTLRASRRRSVKGEMGVRVATSITRVHSDGLLYRGVNVAELLDRKLSFESVCEHLWETADSPGWRPAALPIDDSSVSSWTLDGLRYSLLRLRTLDAAPYRFEREEVLGTARTSLATMARELSRGGSHSGARQYANIGAAVSCLSPYPKKARSSVETALILLADHGLATSTLGVRVAASVRTDVYSALITGLSNVAGLLHGRASREVYALLKGERTFPSSATLPAIGHRVYTRGDPREALLFEELRRVFGDTKRFEKVSQLRRRLEKHGRPNIDFALGALTYLARMPQDAGEIIFGIARCAGWTAHYLEELFEEPTRFRAEARYEGLLR